MNYWAFLILPILIFTTPIFGQTPSDDLSNSSDYVLEIDGHVYSISYVVNADIIAMEIDPESRSLLIGLDKTGTVRVLSTQMLFQNPQVLL